MRTAKTDGGRGCAQDDPSSLGAHVFLLVLLCAGSNILLSKAEQNRRENNEIISYARFELILIEISQEDAELRQCFSEWGRVIELPG